MIKRHHYVVLAGSRNNSGDYLIRHRALQLLERYRPDRDIVCIDSWKPLDEAAIQVINEAAALLLTGGPSLKKDMYPAVFPLVDDLSLIKAPIILYGVGCNDPEREATWPDSRGFAFASRTRQLLDRVNESGYLSSVRDYFALNALASNGYRRIAMTGCPALYSGQPASNAMTFPKKPLKISFSPGATFAKDLLADDLQKQLILKCRSAYPESALAVVFHHSLDADVFGEAYGALTVRFHRQKRLVTWLEEQGIAYVDVSGSHAAMIEHYSDCDFHIGFRVHAHALMTSLARPSILIAEDGRGLALRTVLGGAIFDSFVRQPSRSMFACRIERVTDIDVVDDVLDAMRYEIENDHPRTRSARRSIEEHHAVMQRFLNQLP